MRLKAPWPGEHSGRGHMWSEDLEVGKRSVGTSPKPAWPRVPTPWYLQKASGHHSLRPSQLQPWPGSRSVSGGGTGTGPREVRATS